MKLKAVIFDQDGVLVNTEPLRAKSMNDAVKHFGGTREYTLQDKMLHNGVRADDTFLEIRKTWIKNPDLTFAEYRKYQKEQYFKYLENEAPKPLEGVLDLLNSLKSKGIKVAVGTSSAKATGEKALLYSGLSPFFDVVVTGDDVEHGKPAPDIFLECARRLGVSVKEVIVIGDSKNDGLGARACGMKFVFKTNGTIDIGMKPDMIVSSMTDLTVEMLENLL